MYYFICVIIGYLTGCVNPSYILGKLKRVDMRRSGTKNLGASNAFISLGRGWGVFVMLFDIFKSLLAVFICSLLFPELALAGIVAGSSCVLGHNHPFYLGFRGGKGLASYGGFVLAISPTLFFLLLFFCLTIAFLLNYGCTIALTASLIFPVLAGIKFNSIAAFFIVAICSASMFYKHTENLRRIKAGEERQFRAFIGKYILQKNK